MKRNLVWGFFLLLLIGSLTSCRKDDESAAGKTQEQLAEFGDRTYLFTSMGSYKTLSDQGVFEIIGGMLYYTEVDGDTEGEPLILCSDLSCRHVHSDTEDGIPVTCEAEVPYAGGYALYQDGYVYVVSETEYITEYGLYVHRRALDGGGWEEVAFLPGYLLGTAEVAGYQFAENGKVYLAVLELQEVEMAFGSLQNSCFGVMELTLASGEYRMIVPVKDDAYQNVYYMNLLGDTFVYCYVSASASLMEEMKDANFDAIAEAFYEKSTTKVLTVNMDTLEQTQFGEYGQKGNSPEEMKAAEAYFVDVYQDGVAYVEDRTLYLKLYEDGTVYKLAEVPENHMVSGVRFTDVLRIQEEGFDESNTFQVISVSDVKKDGTLTQQDMVAESVVVRLCLDNGFSLVQFPNSEKWESSVCLVQEEDVRDGQIPETVYYYFNE